MPNNLEYLPPTLKYGNEQLLNTGKTLLDFWRWNGSDIISNAARGRLAEFIVATAMKIDTSIPRSEWDAWDLTSPEGIRIEVKSSAYLQSWKQNRLSNIIFSIRPAQAWNNAIGNFELAKKRNSDIYVFCLLNHTDKPTLNPLDLNQWAFYVLSTIELNEYKRDNISITLSSLKSLTDAVAFENLRMAVIDKHNVSIS